ncbi:EscE/YscE/SsaE family type III secretion system needle protein co-chaperone [Vibrio ostreicida]|uniref:EscE/YscE/SsaE family type III secretion system needle protein co-chaperone n=1 Tax=Vibrio ostreicida TaxID=526588 RepID=A0ABT8BV56_9VIBR|nr:EscE/YscE/SsaE family type III secretion system needle protein co-chaperone [Vibrio ostreicida]MDN3610002.1 EscE/YscE/SsaE family type III secretion system needle protein co-chaperone [Vibrio ostreicida]MDN3611051.1 EscE/YscE/SsaE family type III secretion system needle protein co-chaperone [Vibrio ostreicida]NPD10427.1 hypothetical protein [Vibrio ostreicida]
MPRITQLETQLKKDPSCQKVFNDQLDRARDQLNQADKSVGRPMYLAIDAAQEVINTLSQRYHSI